MSSSFLLWSSPGRLKCVYIPEKNRLGDPFFPHFQGLLLTPLLTYPEENNWWQMCETAKHKFFYISLLLFMCEWPRWKWFSSLWHSNKKELHDSQTRYKDMWEKEEEGAFLLRSLEEIYISGKSLGTVLKYWSLFLQPTAASHTFVKKESFAIETSFQWDHIHWLLDKVRPR